MKKFLLAISAVAALFAVSCTKDSELVLGSTAVTLSGDGTDSFELKVVSNSEWESKPSADWLSVSPSSGKGDAVAKITVKANPNMKERKANIGFYTKDKSVVRYITVTQAARQRGEGESPIDNIVIAHRGACKEFNFPDNSQAGLRKAIELNLYGSECDINITSDGVVVVTHGTSFGGKAIKDTPYATLKSAGKLTNGETLPTFREYLETAMKGNGTKIIVDVKSLSDDAGGNNQSIKAGVAAAKLVKEMHAEDYVSFIIGRAAVYNGVIGSVGKAWPVAYMNADAAKSTFSGMGCTWGNFDISSFAKNSAGNFDPSICESKLKEWNAAGVDVSFYNIDTEAQIQWWLPHKDDVMACTNYPMALMKRLGLR